MSRRASFVTLVTIAMLMLAGPAFAQVDPNVQQGLKPYGTFSGGDIDSISMANGNLTLNIPLFSYPQRGNVKLDYSIVYNNKSYMYKTICNKILGCTHYWIWRGNGVEVKPAFEISQGTVIVQASSTDVVHINYAISPDGAEHVLGQTLSGTYESTDATGIQSNGASLAVLVDQTGIRYPQGAVGSGSCYENFEEDTNGNEVCAPSSGGLWIDTVGRTVPYRSSTTDYSGCTGPLSIVSAQTWSVPGPGGDSTFKLCSASVPIVLSYNLDQDTQVDGTAKMIQSVVLPDGTAWTFTYSSDENGNLAQVTFPTGGTLSYTWTTWNHCNQSLGSPSFAVASRALNSNDGTGSHTWSYSWSGYNPTLTATKTDPLGNDTLYTETGLDGCSFYTTSAKYYQGSHTSGTLLKTVTTNYSYASSPFAAWMGNSGGAMNVVPTQITTTWPDGRTKQIQETYDSGFTFHDPDPQSTQTYTGIYGKVTSESDYDYGNGSPGPLLRKTATSYLALQDSNYLANNLLSLPSAVLVYDGGGSVVARTDYGYDQYSLQSSGVTTQHDSNPPAGAYRGNLTSVQRWLNGSTVSTTECSVSVSNGYLVSKKTYFDTGMVYQATDPCGQTGQAGHTTTYSYSSSFAGAYVTQTNLPDTNSPNLAHHVIKGDYNFNTGLITSFTDQNNQPSTFSYDNMWHLTTAAFPDTGQTHFYYTPSANRVEMQQTIDGSRSTDTYVIFDGLGRQIRRITANDEPTPWDQVDICYDALGRVGFKSYPYQGTGLSSSQVCSGAGDSFTYDALGRQKIEIHSDSSAIHTTYVGAATEVTDEGNGTSNVERVSQVDGLGRLVSVCEVTGATQMGTSGTPAACGQDIGATGFLTAYGYNALGNLTAVSQAGLSARTFQYDSLSELLSSTNPEAGTIQYSYDADGNAVSRVAPAPNQTNPAVHVTTTYTYDALNRLLSKSYSDGTTPEAFYHYDEASALGVSLTYTDGRASSAYVKNASGTVLAEEVTGYNRMGRPTTDSQCTPQNCSAPAVFPIGYTYDYMGDIVTATNGKGVTLTYTHNRALRVTKVTSSYSDSNHPGTLLSGVHYNAYGFDTSATLGNNVTDALGYAARGWLQSLSVTLNASTVYSFSLTFAPDGDVTEANDSVNGNWTYTYDGFNRLATSNKNSGQLSYTYKYDRYGNMWQGDGSLSISFSGGNNRIDGSSGYSYDAAGNVINDGVHSYTYDAENRIIQVDSGGTATYVYDAQGRRVRKTVSGVSVDYLYDLAGHVITEVNSSGGWSRGEVFAGGNHIATYYNSTTYFSHADWIGTERARTGVSGNVVETCTGLPFGDWQSCSGGDVSQLHFTGKRRDTETGLDDFNARYYASTAGRFMSPDWSAKPQGVPYAQFADPQSLNLYVYVEDDPITGLDVDGHGQAPRNAGCQKSATCKPQGESSDNGEASTPAPPKTAQQQNSSKLNKDKFVNYMDQHAKNKSTGYCAMACRKGLAAGGLNTSGHPGDAKDYGPFLLKRGASVVPNKNYKPQKGDVVVFGGNKSHPYGHIETYNGKGWVSDFKQHSMIPYRSDVPPHTIYRFPDDQ